MNIHDRAATYAEHPFANGLAAKWQGGERWRLLVVLFSPIAAASCSSIDSPYSPPPLERQLRSSRGLLINGESINGGLRGIPKKSQRRDTGLGMDPPDGSFWRNEKWKPKKCNWKGNDKG